MNLPMHPYVLLALAKEAPSREVERLRVTASEKRIEIDGGDALDLATLFLAPTKGQTTAGKVLELPPRHPLWREARPMTGIWTEIGLASAA